MGESKAGRPRPRGLPRRRNRPHDQGTPDQPPQRTVAVELATAACQTGGMSAEDKPQTETIATLHIDLIDSDQPIWREVEVPLAMTLKQLHGTIQAAMGWEDAHLWEFTLGRERIGSSRAARLTLQDLLRPRVTKLGYTYDMGDCWQHQLTLTKPRPA